MGEFVRVSTKLENLFAEHEPHYDTVVMVEKISSIQLCFDKDRRELYGVVVLDNLSVFYIGYVKKYRTFDMDTFDLVEWYQKRKEDYEKQAEMDVDKIVDAARKYVENVKKEMEGEDNG